MFGLNALLFQTVTKIDAAMMKKYQNVFALISTNIMCSPATCYSVTNMLIKPACKQTIYESASSM